ncbi:hypothetical protein CV83906_3406 [Escherichia coli]|nr:hypothetical protein CV83906_3406 [Escherichia coli]
MAGVKLLECSHQAAVVSDGTVRTWLYAGLLLFSVSLYTR